ncbi:MAG: DNA polymerase Y family protein [Chitinophagaceae bacterium]
MGKRFVVIWLPYFHTDLVAGKEKHLHQQPFALKESFHGKMVIRALNLPAQRLGLANGQAIADARAIASNLQVKDLDVALAKKALEKLGRWCIRFTPVVGLDAPDGLILEASGCAHLWGGEEKYLQSIKEKMESFGISTRMAMADTIGVAWALAHYGPLQLHIAFGTSIPDFLELPVAALRIDESIQDQLQILGLRSVRQLFALPLTVLNKRFPALLCERIKQASGEMEEYFLPIELPESFAIRLPCLEPIITRTGVNIALEKALLELIQLLQQQQLGIRKAVFTAFAADGKQYDAEIMTNRPSLHEAHLLKLFALRLDRIEYSAGIDLFMLSATLTERYQPAQEKIWKGRTGLHHQQIAEWVDQISMRYGPNAVSRYLPSEHHLPEKAFRESTGLQEDATSSWHVPTRRPIQLIHPPEIIEVTAPIPDYPPMLFRHKGKLHKIITADGPERIEQEWWAGTGKHRDYYIVEDEEGKRYWLFRSGHYDKDKTYNWYLHGYFV